MQGRDDDDKREGEKILINYKKQLAERMAREQIESNDFMGQKKKGADAKSSSSYMGGTQYSKKSNKDDNEAMKLVSQKM